MCRPITDHVGTAAAYVNLAHYDRTWSAGGNLVQLGIWQRSTDPHPYFAYTEDNTGGGLQLLGAPYPARGHRYLFGIEWRAGKWRLSVYDATRGVVVHNIALVAHWSDARSAWVMLETNDPLQSFPPDPFGMAGCHRRIVHAEGQGLYSVSAIPCTGR